MDIMESNSLTMLAEQAKQIINAKHSLMACILLQDTAQTRNEFDNFDSRFTGFNKTHNKIIH